MLLQKLLSLIPCCHWTQKYDYLDVTEALKNQDQTNDVTTIACYS
jgi:hypothetical protein